MASMDSPERLWRTKFDKQLTNEMMERVLKQTIALIYRVEGMTPWKDILGADDRLQQVIVKTLDGTLTWDPARVDLERFFLQAIAGEISHELEHAEKFPHASLEDDEFQDLEALEDEAGAALNDQREVKHEVPKHEWWSTVMEVLREKANGDRGVLAIIDAWDNGALTKREVLELARMSSRTYHAAYQRLMRVAAKIDDSVRELIFKAMA